MDVELSSVMDDLIDILLVEKIVAELKSQGLFDQLRKDCMADVDTKPAYQNLRQRVEASVSELLRKKNWKPELNKNQLRESIRRYLFDDHLEAGIDRILNQVINQKVYKSVVPVIEDVMYNTMGIVKPQQNNDSDQPGERATTEAETGSSNLLPSGLDPVSPSDNEQPQDSDKKKSPAETTASSENSTIRDSNGQSQGGAVSEQPTGETSNEQSSGATQGERSTNDPPNKQSTGGTPSEQDTGGSKVVTSLKQELPCIPGGISYIGTSSLGEGVMVQYIIPPVPPLPKVKVSEGDYFDFIGQSEAPDYFEQEELKNPLHILMQESGKKKEELERKMKEREKKAEISQNTHDKKVHNKSHKHKSGKEKNKSDTHKSTSSESVAKEKESKHKEKSRSIGNTEKKEHSDKNVRDAKQHTSSSVKGHTQHTYNNSRDIKHKSESKSSSSKHHSSSKSRDSKGSSQKSEKDYKNKNTQHSPQVTKKREHKQPESKSKERSSQDIIGQQKVQNEEKTESKRKETDSTAKQLTASQDQNQNKRERSDSKTSNTNNQSHPKPLINAKQQNKNIQTDFSDNEYVEIVYDSMAQNKPRKLDLCAMETIDIPIGNEGGSTSWIVVGGDYDTRVVTKNSFSIVSSQKGKNLSVSVKNKCDSRKSFEEREELRESWESSRLFRCESPQKGINNEPLKTVNKTHGDTTKSTEHITSAIKTVLNKNIILVDLADDSSPNDSIKESAQEKIETGSEKLTKEVEKNSQTKNKNLKQMNPLLSENEKVLSKDPEDELKVVDSDIQETETNLKVSEEFGGNKAAERNMTIDKEVDLAEKPDQMKKNIVLDTSDEDCLYFEPVNQANEDPLTNMVKKFEKNEELISCSSSEASDLDVPSESPESVILELTETEYERLSLTCPELLKNHSEVTEENGAKQTSKMASKRSPSPQPMKRRSSSGGETRTITPQKKPRLSVDKKLSGKGKQIIKGMSKTHPNSGAQESRTEQTSYSVETLSITSANKTSKLGKRVPPPPPPPPTPPPSANKQNITKRVKRVSTVSRPGNVNQNQQRYDNSDLYKPRLSFTTTRRLRESSGASTSPSALSVKDKKNKKKK